MNVKPRVIEFSSVHNDDRVTPEENCQLFVAMTGSKEYIIRKLEGLIKECYSGYGKPCQGTAGSSSGYISVITPVWEGTQYD